MLCGKGGADAIDADLRVLRIVEVGKGEIVIIARQPNARGKGYGIFCLCPVDSLSSRTRLMARISSRS